MSIEGRPLPGKQPVGFTALIIAAIVLAMVSAVISYTGMNYLFKKASEAEKISDKWPVIISDSFSDNTGNWPVGRQIEIDGRLTSVDFDIVQEKFRLTTDTIQRDDWIVPVNEESYRDFSISIDVNQIDDNPWAAYGLYFREYRSESYGYSYFVINNGGEFSFCQYESFKCQTHIDWQKTNAIHANQVNQLQVIARGSQFTLLINSQMVYQAEAGGKPLGKAGLYVLHLIEGESIVEFDNLILRASPGGYATLSPAILKTDASRTLPGNDLVFASDRDGDLDIYVYPNNIFSSKTNLRQLTDHPAADFEPVWSPDKRQLAFVSTRDGNPEIYLIDINGKNLRRLTENPAKDTLPAWSPDGKEIALVSTRDGNAEIYLLNVESGQPVRLTNHLAEDTHPAWSPDGRQIIFQSDRDGDMELYTMSRDGDLLQQVTTNEVYDGEPDWSPDGFYFAFVSERESLADIYVCEAVKCNPRRLSGKFDSERRQPVWEPNGGMLSYIALVEGVTNIFWQPISELGSAIYRLEPGNKQDPDW